jgi:hypothetical protein
LLQHVLTNPSPSSRGSPFLYYLSILLSKERQNRKLVNFYWAPLLSDMIKCIWYCFALQILTTTYWDGFHLYFSCRSWDSRLDCTAISDLSWGLTHIFQAPHSFYSMVILAFNKIPSYLYLYGDHCYPTFLKSVKSPNSLISYSEMAHFISILVSEATM